MKVHITGFTPKEKEEFTQKIQDLRLIVDENLTMKTNLLICDSIFSQKYRMAKILDIKVVTKNWLIESHRLKTDQDFKIHEFGIFQNLKIHFFGFDIFKFETLNEITKKCNGVPIKDLTKAFSGEEKINFVVVKEGSQFEKLYPLRQNVILVFLPWFYNCLKYERFIYPDSFLLPFCDLTPLKVNIKIQLKDLERLIEQTELNSEVFNILGKTIFYFLPFDSSGQTIQQSFQEEEAISSRLVVLLNGFVAHKKLKNVTHVVTNFIDEEEKDRLQKNGEVYFVNYTYLKDCMLYKKRLLELDYPPKMTENQASKNQLNNINDSKNSNTGFGTRTTRNNLERSSVTFKSFLFENFLFYLSTNLKQRTKYNYLVFENSGSILIDLNRDAIGNRRLYYVLDDGFSMEEIQRMKHSLKDKTICFISPRWIDFCIEKKSIIKDVEAERHVNLLPFQFVTPFPDFERLDISLKGFEAIDKLILSDVIRIIGAKYQKFDLENDNQIKIFKDFNQDCSRIKNGKPLMWLFECIQTGKQPEEDKLEVE